MWYHRAVVLLHLYPEAVTAESSQPEPYQSVLTTRLAMRLSPRVHVLLTQAAHSHSNTQSPDGLDTAPCTSERRIDALGSPVDSGSRFQVRSTSLRTATNLCSWGHGTHHGNMVPRRLLWYHRTMLPWYHGIMASWYHGKNGNYDGTLIVPVPCRLSSQDRKHLIGHETSGTPGRREQKNTIFLHRKFVLGRAEP